MKIVLLGYMSAGKSTLGASFSIALGIPFYDLDSLIEEEVKMPISQIFTEKGELFFRKTERTTLEKMLSKSHDFVLSLGGGTPCYGDSMERINATENTISVYLKSSVDTLTERLWIHKEKRPLIAHLQTKELLNEFIRKHLFERAFYYNQSDLIIETDAKSVKTITEELILALF